MSTAAAGASVTVSWGGRSTAVSCDPTPPRVEGRHAWTAALMFDITSPDRADLLADHENLRSISIFCWWCRASTDDGSSCPGVPG